MRHFPSFLLPQFLGSLSLPFIMTLACSQRHIIIPEAPYYVIMPPPFFASDDEDEESDDVFGARWKPEARGGGV